MIDKDKIIHLAWLAKLEIDNIDLYEEQLNKIIEYFNILDEVDTKSEPQYVIKDIELFREDIPRKYEEDIFNMLNNKKDRFVKAPKMV
jgi:aspartyl-tRNA(Asn)/glutamyl-tRNA(Gln) amidotransferase subunit C